MADDTNYRKALLQLLIKDATENGSPVDMLVDTLKLGCKGWLNETTEDVEVQALDCYEHLKGLSLGYENLNDKQFIKKLIETNLGVKIFNSIEFITEDTP